MAKYPDECPVFRRKRTGRDYTFRPAMQAADAADRAEIGDSCELEMPTIEDYEFDDMTYMDECEPLTRAARELVQWVQS